MKNIMLAFALCASGSSLAVPVFAEHLDLEKMYFDSDKNPKLSGDEHAAVAKQKAWNQTASVTPFIGKGGSVQFVFGAQEPSIVCAVMQVCDIALQAGEQINSLNVGDTARWNVDPSVSGTGGSEVQHLIIKPLDVGLETSMVIGTDRRTYHLKLRSHRTIYMSNVSFSYPEEQQLKFAAIAHQAMQERKDKTIPETGEYLGELDFGYKIRGKATFRPVRVFNDGRKTIVQLPDSVRNDEAPSLLVVTPSSSTPGLVNSRLQNNRFVVDQLFDRAVLVVGVGGAKKQVTIIRNHHDSEE